jgi:hypothetical protein
MMWHLGASTFWGFSVPHQHVPTSYGESTISAKLRAVSPLWACMYDRVLRDTITLAIFIFKSPAENYGCQTA